MRPQACVRRQCVRRQSASAGEVRPQARCVIKVISKHKNTKCKINFRIYYTGLVSIFFLYQTFKEEFSMKKQEVKIVKAAVQRSAKSWIRV